MNLYAIRRRDLCGSEEVESVDARSRAELAKRADRVQKVRSYVFDEGEGRLGSLCLYEADGVEVISEHAEAAGLPCDEVNLVGAIDVDRPDPDLSSA